jgi:hypothetical protein
LPLPTSPVHFKPSHPFLQSHPLPCVLDFSLLFIVQVFFFFLRGVVSLPRGLCWFILGVAGSIPRDSWHSPVWSVECLTGKFGACSGGGGVWWQQSSCFFQCNIAWRSFPQTKGSGCRSFDSPCQVWLQGLSKVLESRSLHHLVPHPNRHPGSILKHVKSNNLGWFKCLYFTMSVEMFGVQSL